MITLGLSIYMNLYNSDVNECTSFGNADVCSELNAECTNTVGGFTCDTCRRGFEPDGTDGDCCEFTFKFQYLYLILMIRLLLIEMSQEHV